jgi:hypothetical protein
VLVVEQLRNAKIEDDGNRMSEMVLLQSNVARLQIAMNDARIVRRRDGREDGQNAVGYRARRERMLAQIQRWIKRYGIDPTSFGGASEIAKKG